MKAKKEALYPRKVINQGDECSRISKGDPGFRCFCWLLVISVLKCTKLEHLGQKVLQEKSFF